MMDEILNSHYAKMNIASSQAIPQSSRLHLNVPNGFNRKSELVLNTTKDVQVVPETNESKNYIYIRVDDEISIKPPVKPTNSFAKFVAGTKVSKNEKRRLEIDLSNIPEVPNISSKQPEKL